MRYLVVSTITVALLIIVEMYWIAGTRYNVRVTDAIPSISPVKLQPPDEQESRASFLAVGDIMLSRHVAARIEQQGDPLMPFRNLTELLSSTDFNFGNLESPVSGRDNVKGRGLVFNTAGKDLEGLACYNFKLVNLANNHSLDQRLDGLENTRRVLSDQGISYLGVGDCKAAAWEPKIINVNGIRIGFLGASYASINDGGVERNDYVARIEDLTELKDALIKLRAEADFIVVTMHAGIEFKRYPHSSQINFARAAIDLGADLVIGAHPHWIQTVELYQGKYIFYSLGNFIFDADHEDTSQGLTVRVVLRKRKFQQPAKAQSTQAAAELERIELIPVVIQQCSPRPAMVKEAERILQKIGVRETIMTRGETELVRN